VRGPGGYDRTVAVTTDNSTLPGRAVSPWLDGTPRVARPALTADRTADIVVIGGGIVGVSAALELARDGAEVVLLEGRRIGAGVTGNSTAKLSSLHGVHYDSLVSTHGADVARIYAEANERGLARVRELAGELGIQCDLRTKPNFTYTEDPGQVADLQAEAEACRAAGLQVQTTTDVDLPFEVAAAIRLDDQAEFDPVPYLEGLADAVEKAGGAVHEGTWATQVAGQRVTTRDGAVIRADRVVVATQIPFLDRGLFFAREHVQRSYAVTARLDGPVPQGMYLQSESPSTSLRAVPWEGGELLLVGGQSHELGHGDAVEKFEALEKLARERFPVAGFEHRWSAHDFMPDDGLPYVGRLQPLSDRVLTVTGLHKWGLAFGAEAGRILADVVAGRPNEGAETFDPWRLPPLSGAAQWAKHNADSGVHFFADRAKRGGSVEDLAPGEGGVFGDGIAQKAVHRDDDGVLHAVSARCTHLGCIVRWNGAERTWDCPCHGSRFEAGGDVANGPATRPLEQRPV
jgi:glycine/D-amino acid oxidase-like deaminating enzyme/nitrite reductase/ring-hydroxylating ferredoxin subunit